MTLDRPRPLYWRGTAKADFMGFPPEVQRDMGFALFLAQMGERHPTDAKTLKGFAGGTVIEIKERHDGNAYRAVYTIRFADAVYVLHAFQKKSRQGIATPPQEIARVRQRLAALIEEREKRR